MAMTLQSPALAPSDPHVQAQVQHHAGTAATAAARQANTAQVFEFTKRKKWADILISELPDTVTLILDADGQIQYVAPNATDVLGWQVEELSETDVLEIINDFDKRTFNDHLQQSLNSRQDLSCYARLKCKPLIGKAGSEQSSKNRDGNNAANNNKELLFEIRGHGLYLPDDDGDGDDECKCFFLVAKPYPSRNMAVLNTFLELKIENERLTQRLKDLKAQDVMPSTYLPLGISPSSAHSIHAQSQFATLEFPMETRDENRSGGVQSPSTASGTTGSFSTIQSGGHHHHHHLGFVVNPTAGAGAGATGVPGTGSNAVSLDSSRDEEVEEGGKKRKQKKGDGQQHVCVTCGRTDSPEWRKGPRGPKTLCNACGLRWAKRSKRTDDVPIPYVQSNNSDSREERDGDSPPGSGSGSGGSAGTGGGGSGGRSGRGPGAPVANAELSVTPPTELMRSSSSSQQQQQQQQQRESLNQSQSHQSRYENAPVARQQQQQVPTPSPTHASFPASQVLSHSQTQSHGQCQMQEYSSGQYSLHPTPHPHPHPHSQPHPHPMISPAHHPRAHAQSSMQMDVQPSPTSVHPPHPHAHAHAYVHSHVPPQAHAPHQQHPHSQSQSQRHDHYQTVYESGPYHWSVESHHQHHGSGGEGGAYGY